jgi:hypothetical protein
LRSSDRCYITTRTAAEDNDIKIHFIKIWDANVSRSCAMKNFQTNIRRSDQVNVSALMNE